MELGKKSIVWAAAEPGGTTVLSVVTMLVMARMMGPEEFGMAALVLGGIQFLNLFVGGFFHDALIQNPETDERKFQSAFSLILIIAGCILAAGVIVAVALRDTGWSAIAWLSVGCAFSLPFNGAVGIGNARLRRELKFREVAKASLLGRLLGSVLGIGLALLSLNAWSLIGQYTAIAIIQAGLLCWFSDWRPRLRGSFRSLWPISRFALPYACMHSLVALRLQGFQMMVAGSIGLTAAGYLNVAFRLTTTPQVLLTTAFTNLGLPLLANHNNGSASLDGSFLMLTRMVMSTMIPAFVGLALTADELVQVLLGRMWMAAIPPVQWLALGAAVSFIRLPASSVLRALGHVRYSFASASFQLAFTCIGMLVLRPHGLAIPVFLWVMPALLQLPVTFLAVRWESSIGWRTIWVGLFPTFIATAAMFVALMVAGQAMQDEPVLYRLVVKVACGAAAAILALLIADSRVRAVISAIFKKAPA